MKSKWKLPALAMVLLLPFFAAALTACGLSAEEKNAMNLDTGLVKIEIEGHRFDIPLRYMYGQTVETYGRWPTPKTEREQVGGLSLSVLLPDMRPYYKEDDARWKVQGHGERVEVSIAKPVGSWSEWYPHMLKETERFTAEGRFYHKEPVSYNLIHYSGKTGDSYFAQGGQNTAITCNKPEPPPKWNGFYSPGCKVKSNYQPGLVIEYYYALQYLSQWKEIDDRLKAMFDKFALATQTQTK
jgi:hypothetical protein